MPQSLQELKKPLLFLFVLSAALSFYTATFQHMNNFLIFKSSFFHLLNGQSLYQFYPGEHNDLFKYSPTFALFMGALAYFPAPIGATLWNLLGTTLFAYALLRLPVKAPTKKAVFWITLPEFIGSTQNFQSNIHIIALLMLYWVALEEKRPWLAALTLLSSFYIKIFGILGLGLFLFSDYSVRNKKFFLRFVMSFVVSFMALTFSPALLTGLKNLLFQYQEWARMLENDVSISYGFSLMGFVHALTKTHFNPILVQIAGGLLWLTFLFLGRNTNQQGRLLGFISLCYFFVVFNHKSESPTFIIPMVAFGLHQSYFQKPKQRWGWILLTLGFVSLLYADPFRAWRPVFDQYCVKVIPFLLLTPLIFKFLIGGEKAQKIS